MCRRPAVFAALVLAAVIGTTPATGGPQPPASSAGQAGANPAAAPLAPPADPFPILRLRPTEAQLPALLKQLDSGQLVRLPRTEFEAQVRAAEQMAATLKPAPRLVDARFNATLVNGDLEGTAELDIDSASTVPQFLVLDPLRIGTGPATWAEGGEAILGTPVGGNAAGVWVEKPGRQTLRFKWSAAGTTELGERHFELRLPVAPTATLDLDLPEGQIPTTSTADVLLTSDPPRVPWRFRFGGRSRLEFAVRPAGDPGATAAATLSARYDFLPSQLNCRFEYDLKPAKGTINEWLFSVDPSLRVTDVVVNNRAKWGFDPAGPDGTRRLRVTLRQPGNGGKVLIVAAAPFPDPTRSPEAPLPVIRPIGAALDDEDWELRLPPGMKPENWTPGDYRITDTATLSDQTRVVSLVGTLLPPGVERTFRQPPTLRIAPTESEFTTTEQLAWRVDADRITANVRLGVRVQRGPLFHLVLRVPADYTLARSSSTPADLIIHDGPAPAGVLLEFARPLLTGQSATLTLEFRGPQAAPHRSFQFPAFAPVGATERDGVFAVCPGPLWTAEVQSGVGMKPVGWLDLSGPPAPADAVAAFRYRSSDPDGSVTLETARAVFTVGNSITTSEPDRVTETFTIQLRGGAVPGLLISERAPSTAERTWRVVSGKTAIVAAVPVSLPQLARRLVPPIPHWRGRFGLAASLERLWLLRFAQPVTGEVILDTTTLADSRHPPRLTVMGGELAVVPTSVVPSTAQPPVSSEWEFRGLYLVTVVPSSTEASVAFGGVIRTAAQPLVPIQLPPGAEPRAAAVNGRWLSPGAWRFAGEGLLELPVPADGETRFEVRYRLPVERLGPVGQIRSPEPGLPIAAEIRRWWAFGENVLPGWPVRSWENESSAELPELVGGLPDSVRGVVVSRSPVAEVRIGSADAARTLGILMAAAVLALAWAGGWRRHPLCGLLVVLGLLLAGTANLLGPPWWQHAARIPLIVGLLAATALVCFRGLRSTRPALAVAALVLILLRPDSTAQTVAPAVVVILPTEMNGREEVLVPKSLLDRLTANPNPDVIFTEAEYTLVADEATARITAKFVVHALGEGESLALLPLTDARMEKATVDKKDAFPTMPRPGVFAIPLPGKGRYTIEVRFVVPVAGTGSEREVKFGVPEVPAAHITTDLPGSARQPQLVGRFGRQLTTSAERVRTETDLGAVKTVQLRWRDGIGGTATVKVREGCVWDVTEGGADLTACYLVRIEQGTVSSLRFDVPADLQLLEVVVRPLDTGGSAALRDWVFIGEQNGQKQLRVDFQGPTGGRVLVVLKCSPRNPITRQPVLRFPRVVLSGGPAEPDAAYGLRAKGVSVEEHGRAGVIDFTADALTRDFAGVTELRLDPNTPVRVFRPVASATAELRPTLRPVAELPGFTIDTGWHIGPHRADAEGTIRWTGKDSAALVEFLVPGVKVLEVRGPDVTSWTSVNGRVQVWMRKPVKDGEVQWIGTATLAPSGKPPEPVPFDVISPRIVDARLQIETLRVRPADGWTLRVERDRGWSETSSTSGNRTFRALVPAPPPLRVVLNATRGVLRADQLGWLSPSTVPPATSVRPPDLLPGLPRSRPPEPSALSTTPAAAWVWPVSAAVGWALALAAFGVLFARFPRSTWPEQVGILGGLFGLAVVGHWWIGLGVWAVARGLGLAMSGRLGRGPLTAGQY